ncbi:MAG: AAA family ATPase [Gammaproteobacteria bacterium]|nr:MAG: AAA family ATPase [Gammaproteobacteria bacterium]RLA11775.1 MAG: AAA family ATPase [Gammaproteobacteria bacterium]
MTPLEQLQQLDTQIQSRIIGQKSLVNRLLIALLADGHLLVEGAPGLAKTRAIKSLGDALEGDFHRVQFTPDLLPADLTGTEIYRPQDGTFKFQKGPLFHNLVLADEINRAPAKVQSALLEAMAERQITVGSQTWPLPELFLVMATQNPLEQEGTYPLPEAQLDRFLLQVNIDYPSSDDELTILRLARDEAETQHQVAEPIKLTQQALFTARDQVLAVHMSESIEAYIVELIIATRDAGRYGDDLARWLAYGASPRATIALDRAARAHAWLAGKDYVGPEDVQALSHDVLRHRLILNYEAEAEGVSVDQIIDELIARVAVP